MNLRFLTVVFSFFVVSVSGQADFGVKAFYSMGTADTKVKEYVTLTPDASTPVTISQIAYKGTTASNTEAHYWIQQWILKLKKLI